ncbi:MAG: SURF1 family protein [Gammaproteobacteria bacterium]|nr:SURF1 family protein [Gammaproteobacteria bacterium]
MLKVLLTKCLRIRLFQSNRVLVVNYFLFTIFIGLLVILLNLGFWQLDRTEEKKQLIDQMQTMKQKAPRSLAVLDVPDDYQEVTFSGQVLAETVFIANEPNKGRDGYNVLSLIQISNNTVVWLNRGWVEALPDRRNLPAVNSLPSQIEARGEVYYQKGEPVLFDGALQKKSEHTWLLQGFSFKYLNSIPMPSNSKLLPFIIRLDPSSEYGFERDWQYIAMPPEKHLAYAIQWFGLAFTLIIIFLVTSIKKSNPDGF